MTSFNYLFPAFYIQFMRYWFSKNELIDGDETRYLDNMFIRAVGYGSAENIWDCICVIAKRY